MEKVSIGLRGWRFDVDDVFDADGELRPIEEMPSDVRDRVSRLTALVGAPCDACWLIHGDAGLDRCEPAAAVYGEPLGEVVLCADHETDFLYWFREAGGDAHRGSRALGDAFHEWFADGGRAPTGYAGVEHVDTEPEAVPRPKRRQPDPASFDVPESDRASIDLRALTPDEGTADDGDDGTDRDGPRSATGDG